MTVYSLPMPKCLQCDRNFDRTRRYPVQMYCSSKCGNLYRVQAFREKKKREPKSREVQ